MHVKSLGTLRTDCDDDEIQNKSIKNQMSFGANAKVQRKM